MKALILVALLAAIPKAYADVSDSGNLLIGGNGVFGGTMAVQGNAFSVGGATFTVAGGSITLGGRLNAAVAGITWADGSTSTTAAGGGSGDVMLSATQTFAGANTFAGSTIFSGTIMSPYVLVSSIAFTGVTKATCSLESSSVITSSTVYEVIYRILQNTSNSAHGIHFNADAGNNYNDAVLHCDRVSCVEYGANPHDQLAMTRAPTPVKAGYLNSGTFTISFYPGDMKKVNVAGHGAYVDPSGNAVNVNFSGYYSGASVVSSFYIGVESAGTMTGTIWVRRLQP